MIKYISHDFIKTINYYAIVPKKKRISNTKENKLEKEKEKLILAFYKQESKIFFFFF